jgi:hypothetical protein
MLTFLPNLPIFENSWIVRVIGNLNLEIVWELKFDKLVKSRHSGEPRITSGAGTGVQAILK